MQTSRIKNAANNIATGLATKILQTLLPFVTRTAMIYFMGIEYVGLNGLFTSILQVLNLVELGVGSAMVFSMYDPIVREDAGAICALLRLYKKYYRIIGAAILALGVAIAPFLSNLIEGDVPADIDIHILYFLNLGATVLSYWLFAYMNSLLVAHQRSDVVNKVQFASSTIQYIAQLAIIMLIGNYYVFLATALIMQVVTNLATAFAARRMYPSYVPAGSLDNEEKRRIAHRIRDLFTAKVGGAAVNAVGPIVVSAFLGLAALAIYQNYLYIVTAVAGFFSVAFKAVTASIGNSLITDSKYKSRKDFRSIALLCYFSFGICSTTMVCLLQPFMAVWVGDSFLLPFGVVVLFSVYFYVSQLMNLYSTYKDAAGIWRQDRLRPFCEAVANVVLCFLLVPMMGIAGVLVATIVSMAVVSVPWLLRNLFRFVFETQASSAVFLLIKAVSASMIIGCLLPVICGLVPLEGLIGFAVKGVVCLLGSLVLHFLIFRLFSGFDDSLMLLRKMSSRVALPHQ